ncbi:MAG: hypothetical protein N0C84_14085 [Candidatus Thiodiazotropha taylori]|uniref:Uncharacterized protein n=1 Tax=Candidatus Thiodiazotropha taylori TaxID=2792791 RepID=A0A9E4N464_9GAMM|nr:hypothetical protein [Candidatus Thiodiazotropha taylori]MCW4257587.1 hypothetical protein [Candidatus Thiodiazotropha taylori]
MEERRVGGRPVPDTEIQAINQQQLHGLEILSKFGWKLVCVRSENDLNPAVILENRQNGILGTLETDGVLRLNSNLAIRRSRVFELKSMLSSFGQLLTRVR